MRRDTSVMESTFVIDAVEFLRRGCELEVTIACENYLSDRPADEKLTGANCEGVSLIRGKVS